MKNSIKFATTYRELDGSELAWIDKSVEEGFRCMEIATSALPQDSERRDAVIRYVRDRGVSLNFHAPYRMVNISASDSKLRADSLALVRDAIYLAAKHEVGVITFHPGRLSSPDESSSENLARMLETVEELADLARSLNVRLGLENMELRANELIHTVDELNLFAPIAKKNPYLGVTIDFVHYSTLGIGSPALSSLALPIFDVHLSQNVGGKTHLSLTAENGEVDLSATVRALHDIDYDGFVVFEVLDGHGESLKLLEKIEKEIS